MTTRKIYKAVGGIMSDLHSAFDHYEEMNNWHQAKQAILSAEQQLCNVFKHDNARFDEAKFKDYVDEQTAKKLELF